MGCTGSKPSLLLSGSSHHGHHNHHHNHANGNGAINSPQKGFILFNSKTIDYLKANESDIKEKLKSRCKGKLNVSGASGKSTLLNVRRNLLASNTSATLPVSNGNAGDLAAIDSAVDYVLKYAINDFDIENFKSSNQLSMKQIRKDIMKKYSSTSSSRLSASRLLPNSASSQQQSDTLGAKTGTLQSTVTYSASYYKSALNTAIDEFGLFIQENFININEFEKKMSATDANQTGRSEDDSTKHTANNTDTVKNGEIPAVIEPEPSSTNSTESEEALKLKEALELARQNFYKGKVSMVCLTKKGGYVVKEVQSPPNGTQQSPPPAGATQASQESDGLSTSLSNKLEREDKSVSNISVRSINFDKSRSEEEAAPTPANTLAPSTNSCCLPQSKSQTSTAISDFLNVKNDLAIVLNETIECIVSYSTKTSSSSSPTNLINADKSANDLSHNDTNHQLTQHDKQLKQKHELLFNRANNINNNLIKINNQQQQAANNEQNINIDNNIALLKENLEKSKNIIEILNVINEKDFHLIDEKLVESTLNLDYVNKEFKSYLLLLENSQLQQLEKLENNNNNNNNNSQAEQLNEMLSKNREIRKCVEQIDKLIGDLPGKLFTSKQLPHPVEVNRTDSVKKQQKHEQEKEQEPAQIIDIKKEIAFSILNVGEVLAKTIDYYSIDPTNGQSEELNELIKISESQAAHEKKLLQTTSTSRKSVANETNCLQVNTGPAVTSGEQQQQQAGATVSSTSSLSSPSIASSSSMSQSGSGSVSPGTHTQQAASVEPKSQREPTAPKSDSIQEDIAYLVEEMSAAQHVNNYLNNCDAVELILKREENFERYASSTKDSMTVDDKTSVEQSTGASGAAGAGAATKSSSSSSDILSQDRLEDDDDQDEDQEEDESHSMVHQYINNIIETATKRLETSTTSSTTTTTAEVVVYRNGTELINTSHKRMSLDEELLYQLEDVDKKVKYMNETCSENEDDDDDDELDYMMDPNDDDEDEDDDDERLFHPARRPAKIKSELRQNRKIDLHEEIKQISNVIQDLVQTINIRNETEPTKPLQPSSQSNNGHGTFQKTKSLNNSQTNGNGTPKKPSISSGSGSFSAIPIRQKILTKQKATTIEDNEIKDESTSLKTTIQLSPPSTNLESFVDLSANKSTTPGKFKSKLPVKK